MIPTKFLKSSQKKRILAELEGIYGITALPYLLIETGKKKLRAFSGTLSKEEILELKNLVNVETIGMYMISQKDNDLRLNFDALPLFQKQITKRIIKINKDQLELWLRGYDLEFGARADEHSESAKNKTPATNSHEQYCKGRVGKGTDKVPLLGVQLAPQEKMIRGITILQYQEDLLRLSFLAAEF